MSAPPLECRHGVTVKETGGSLRPLGLAWQVTESSTVLTKAEAKQLQSQDKVPRPEDMLLVRMLPGSQPEWTLTVRINFANSEPEERTFPFERLPARLNEQGLFSAAFVCVHGAAVDEVSFPQVHVLDVSEGEGHAPTLDVLGFGAGPISIQLGDPPPDPKVFRAILRGLNFDHDKTFLLPSAMPAIKRLTRFYKKHAPCDVLVVGHTDTSGQFAYNLALSEKRAKIMAAYLTDVPEAWLPHYGVTSVGKPWGVKEDQFMLSALPDEDAPFLPRDDVDGITGSQTRQATKDFQTFSNDTRGTSLPVDGQLNTATRRELIAAYMEIDETTLREQRFLDVHACGEHHPEVQTGDNVKLEENRRVEVFFFQRKAGLPAEESAIKPSPVDACPSPQGCGEHEQWKEQVHETLDLSKPTGSLRVTVQAKGSKQPMQGVNVSAKGPSLDDDPTDAQGQVLFPFLQVGAYEVQATLEGFAPETKTVEILEEAEQELTIELESFSLKFLVPRGAEPATAGALRLVSEDDAYDVKRDRSEASDEAPDTHKETHLQLLFDGLLPERNYSLFHVFPEGEELPVFLDRPLGELLANIEFRDAPPRDDPTNLEPPPTEYSQTSSHTDPPVEDFKNG